MCVSNADTRRHLRSVNRHLLAVPRFRLNTYGHRAFSVVGPMVWNSVSQSSATKHRHPSDSVCSGIDALDAPLWHQQEQQLHCHATNPAGHSPRPPLSGSAGVFLTVNKRPIHDPPTPSKKFRLPVRSCPSSAQDVYLSVNNHFQNFFKTRSTASQRRTLVSSPFSHAGTVVRRAGKLRCNKILQFLTDGSGYSRASCTTQNIVKILF